MKRNLAAVFGLFLTVAFLIHPTVITAQENTITAADADKYVGQKATVCGIVASATFSNRSKGLVHIVDSESYVSMAPMTCLSSMFLNGGI